MRILALLALTCLLSVPLAAQRMRTPSPEGTVEIAYGDHARQRLDFTPAAAPGAPLVLFVHGGGWSRGDKRIAGHMAAHFHGRGYAFAAINYRLVPDARPDGQAADVAAAIARLRGDARRLGIDPDRIMLIGHSAGAHLVALVGTDPAYLAAHRIPLSAIAGVVPLDGAGYDVPRQIAAAGPFLRRIYANAFGEEPDYQRRVSPVAHAAGPNAARFLILHVASRPDDSGAQSQALAAALRAARTPAEVEAVDGNHMTIFRGFGTPGHRATELTDAFSARIFGSIAR
jgi:acetyl esterase/lipase